MASAAKLSVQIEADIAALRTGLEETVRRVQSTEKTVKTSAEKMQSSLNSSLAGLRTSYLQAAGVIYGAMRTIGKAWELTELAAGYEEQRGILDNLSVKYKTSSDDIVAAMEKASNNMISKVDLMNTALGGLARGLDPQQIINLSNAATLLSDTLGLKATEALNDLTQALETGRTRSLKKYIGSALDLEAVFGKLETKMSEAEKSQAMYLLTMDFVTKMQEQQTKAIDDTADKMEMLEKRYADLKLTAGTYIKETVVGIADMIVKVNDVIDLWERWKQVMSGLFPEFSTLKSWWDKVYEAAKKYFDLKKTPSTYGASNIMEMQIPKQAAPASNKDNEYLKQIDALKKQLEAKYKEASKKTAKDDTKSIMAESARAYERDLSIFAEAEKNKSTIVRDESAERIRELDFAYKYSAQTYEDEASLIMARRDIRLEALNAEQQGIVNTINEYGRSESKQQEIANLRSDWAALDREQLEVTAQATRDLIDAEMTRAANLSASMGDISARLDDMRSQQAISAISAVGGVEAGGIASAIMGEDAYSQQIQAEQDKYDTLLQLFDEYTATLEDKSAGASARLSAIQQAGAERDRNIEKVRFQQRLSVASNTFGMMANIAAQYYEASGRQSEAAFKAYQALQIAQTVVSTASGIMQIWGDASAGPWYVKAGLSAMVAAMGVAQIATISSARPGSGSTTSAGVPAGSYPSPGSASTAPAMAAEKEVVQATPTIQIYVQGNIIDQDKFARELIPAITRAMGDGVR